VAGTVQQAINQGTLSFLLLSAAGGFFAVLMPCVWPMVPITVNFFVKQGQVKNGRPTLLAFVYCLSIIAVFTLVGLLCSIFLGASSLTRLGSNPWLNAMVAVMFFVFGLSLLGLFEIRLPSFLLNASAQGESRGGLIGVVFMALTLTITSFTCTFPVVGGLLVMASRGQYFYPTIGMLTFATVLALPFFLLALAPGLLSRMPRSGDWMNAVKVVGGLIEVGAAFKFVNTAEIGFGATPATAWFDAQVVLSIWVVMLIVCGVYLLGLFRTDHDHDAIKVGPVRLLAGTLFCGLGLYLAPALFGYPPKSKIYASIVGILPADSGELDAKAELAAMNPCPPAGAVKVGEELAAADGDNVARKATSTDPAKAVREERKVHGVAWGLSYEAAIEEAKAKKRPVLIDFTGVNCANCRTMEQTVFPRPDVKEQLRKFVTVSLYTDTLDIGTLTQQQRLDLAEENLNREVDLVDQTSSPYYVVLTPDGKVLASTAFDDSAEGFRNFLKQAYEKFEKEATQKMATEAPANKAETASKSEKTTGVDVDRAVRAERIVHGVPWGLSYEAALEQAKADGRPVLGCVDIDLQRKD
jgi:thiol:disulfide interchange protein DsbD